MEELARGRRVEGRVGMYEVEEVDGANGVDYAPLGQRSRASWRASPVDLLIFADFDGMRSRFEDGRC